MPSSLGMWLDTVPLETSTAAYERLKCREPRVLHACFFNFLLRNSRSALLAPQLGSQFFAANMEISCVRLNQKPAGDAKICLYEMASKVPGFYPERFFKVPHSSLEKERAESFGRVWKVVEPHCLDGVGLLVRL